MCLNSLYRQWLIQFLVVQLMISFNIVYRLFHQLPVDYISGRVIVGNIGNTGIVALSTTDSILSATKFTGYNDRDATVVINY